MKVAASVGAPDLDLAAQGPAGAVLQVDGEVVFLGFDGDPYGRVYFIGRVPCR